MSKFFLHLLRHAARGLAPGLGLLALLAASAAAPAAQPAEHERVRQGVASGAYKPLTGIIADLARQHPGRVVDVESKQGLSGELRYEITLITPEGRKKELLVDAATGRVLVGDQALAHEVMGMAALADHLRRLEQQTRQRVIEVEHERGRDGVPVYQIKLAAPETLTPTRHVRLDARSGAAVPGSGEMAPQAASLRSMPDMLHAMSSHHDGQVIEVELETDARHGPYYELELMQPNGQKLELRVDARSLAVLGSRLSDDD